MSDIVGNANRVKDMRMYEGKWNREIISGKFQCS